MKIISKKIYSKLNLKNRNRNNPVMLKIRDLKIGQRLLVNVEDWNGRSTFRNAVYNMLVYRKPTIEIPNMKVSVESLVS